MTRVARFVLAELLLCPVAHGCYFVLLLALLIEPPPEDPIVRRFLARVVDAARSFLGPASKAVRDNVNRAELGRALAAALMAGGSLEAFLRALHESAGSIFAAPELAALAVALLTFAGDVCRRLEHRDRSASWQTPYDSV